MAATAIAAVVIAPTIAFLKDHDTLRSKLPLFACDVARPMGQRDALEMRRKAPAPPDTAALSDQIDWLKAREGSLTDAQKAQLLALEARLTARVIAGLEAAQGALGDALASYRAGMEIAQALAQDDPANAGWRRDVAVSLWKPAGIPDSGVTWAQVAAALEAMAADGALAPRDAPALEQARRYAGR